MRGATNACVRANVTVYPSESPLATSMRWLNSTIGTAG